MPPPRPRIYREHPDSSYLTAPRVFARVFTRPGTLVDTVQFYENLTATRLDMDMDIPEAGLHVVAVGPFLVLEMSTEQHGLAAQTHVTVLNADLDQAVARQIAAAPRSCRSDGTAPSVPGPGCDTQTD